MLKRDLVIAIGEHLWRSSNGRGFTTRQVARLALKEGVQVSDKYIRDTLTHDGYGVHVFNRTPAIKVIYWGKNEGDNA